MSILRCRTMPPAALAALAVLFVWLVPAQANAASVNYPSGNASTFATSNGGWTSSTEYGGLCIPAVTCPELTGSYQSTGGAAGDGYIRTDSGALTVASLLSTSTQTWTSPAFTYRGVGGKAAGSLRFSVKVKPEVTALLNLGAGVNVGASITEVGGATQTLIADVSPGVETGWKTMSGQLGAGSLRIGKQYRIALTVSVGGLAAVLPAGSVGFDDVTLRATRAGSGNGNGTVLPPPVKVPAGSGYFYRGRLYVRVRCPARFRPICQVRAVVLNRLHRGKPMTRVVRARVKAGKFKRVALVVKPKFRKRVRALAKVRHKSVVLRLNIKSKRGKKKGTVYHSLRVLERRR